MGGGITNAQILGELRKLRTEDLGEIKDKLNELNGRVRETEQVQASLVQSRQDQEKVTDEMRSEIKGLRDKTNWVGTILALGQLVVAAVGAYLFNDGQP